MQEIAPAAHVMQTKLHHFGRQIRRAPERQ